MGSDGQMIFSARHESLLEKLSKSTDIVLCIDEMCRYFEIDFITYHLAFQEGKTIDMPYIKTNYPADWVRQYMIMNYMDVDPILKNGFARALPCLWSDLDWRRHELLPLMRDAKKYGIGSSGYIIPLIDRQTSQGSDQFFFQCASG